MKLDINEVYHNYIIRVVIFSLFTFKRQLRQPQVYKMSVESFVKRRLPWPINLKIDTGIQLTKVEQRELLLDELLFGIESDELTTVTVTFTTPLKTTQFSVDLKMEEKYQSYLYK